MPPDLDGVTLPQGSAIEGPWTGGSRQVELGGYLAAYPPGDARDRISALHREGRVPVRMAGVTP